LKRISFTVAKNAFANVMRGGASAVVALVLPHFLTRSLDVDRFAAWALMLQIAAYANYLDFGLQTAVARYLAQAVERGDDEQRDRIVSAAFALLLVAGVIVFLVLGGVAWQLPHLFHKVPSALIGELRDGVLLLTVSAATLLPLSAFTGVLIGLHRNEFPALAIGVSRILGAVAVVVAVHYTHSLAWLALCIGGFNILGGIAQYAIVMWLMPTLSVQWKHVSKRIVVELTHYCAGLAVWSFSMFLITGLDVTIIGYFDFPAAGYYSIASTLVLFLAGMSNAVFSATIAPVAVLQERKEYKHIGELVVMASRLSSFGSLVLTLPVFIIGEAALRLWVGQKYAIQSLPILEVLLCAQAIRLSGNSFATALIATGEQKYGIPPALIEAIVNLACSVAGAARYGAIGVAWGTLIGAVTAIIFLLLFSMRWTRFVQISISAFLREAFIRPLLCFLPLILTVAFLARQSFNFSHVLAAVTAMAISLFASLKWGGILPPDIKFLLQRRPGLGPTL
jgi:O-antigen/teichoic acid export membrane protein